MQQDMNAQVIEKTRAYDETLAGSDSPEEIKECLNCPYIECLNCREKRGFKKVLEHFLKPPAPILFSATGKARDIADLYLQGYSDEEIVKATGYTSKMVGYWRQQLSLVYVPLETREERKEFINKWLNKFGVRFMAHPQPTLVRIAENTGYR